jgi:hypothetical protein
MVSSPKAIKLKTQKVKQQDKGKNHPFSFQL